MLIYLFPPLKSKKVNPSLPYSALSSHLPEPHSTSYWRLWSIWQLDLLKLSCPPQGPQQQERLSSASRSRSSLLPAGPRVPPARPRMMNSGGTQVCSRTLRRITKQNSAPLLQEHGSKSTHVVDTLTSAKSHVVSQLAVQRKNVTLPCPKRIFCPKFLLIYAHFYKLWLVPVHIEDSGCFWVNKSLYWKLHSSNYSTKTISVLLCEFISDFFFPLLRHINQGTAVGVITVEVFLGWYGIRQHGHHFPAINTSTAAWEEEEEVAVCQTAQLSSAQPVSLPCLSEHSPGALTGAERWYRAVRGRRKKRKEKKHWIITIADGWISVERRGKP